MKNSVPKLRFRDFSGEWLRYEFNDLLKIKLSNGATINKNEYSIEKTNKITVLIDDIFSSDINLNLTNPQYINEAHEERTLAKNDIVINRVSIKPSGVGKLVIVSKIPTNKSLIYESNMFRLRFDSQKIYPKFVAYFGATEQYNKQKLAFARVGNQASLSQPDIARFTILTPTVEEQEKIAGFLEVVDEKIEQLQTKKDLLEKYKKGVMQKIFSQQIRFKDENGKDYPDWQEKRLGELIEIGSSKRVLQQDWQDQGVPFYRTREIINLANDQPFRTPIYISNELYKELSRKYGVPRLGDMLVTGVGSIGSAYLVNSEHKFYFKDGNVIWFKKSENLYPSYLYYAFKSKFVQKQIEDNASITTVATYTIEGAKKTRIKFPSLEEQEKIAEFLTSLDDKINLEESKLEQTKQLKKGLLQQMFV